MLRISMEAATESYVIVSSVHKYYHNVHGACSGTVNAVCCWCWYMLRNTWLLFRAPVVAAWKQMLHIFSLSDAGHNWQRLSSKMSAKKFGPVLWVCVCIHLVCASSLWLSSASFSLSLSVLCLCLLCRSRLADYMVNCCVAPHSASTCPNQDNHQACLASYTRLIGQYSRVIER